MPNDSVAERVASEMPPVIKSLIAQCEANVSKFTNLQMSEALYFGETLHRQVADLTAALAAKDRRIEELEADNDSLRLQLSGAEAMLDAIEKSIPRNEAHRDYSETVQLFVEEAAVASARRQHGVSGMCCALREQEKRRADDLQAQLDRELTEALSLNNEMKALHDEACDERDALRAELTALKSQAIIDREKVNVRHRWR